MLALSLARVAGHVVVQLLREAARLQTYFLPMTCQVDREVLLEIGQKTKRFFPGASNHKLLFKCRHGRQLSGSMDDGSTKCR